MVLKYLCLKAGKTTSEISFGHKTPASPEPACWLSDGAIRQGESTQISFFLFFPFH